MVKFKLSKKNIDWKIKLVDTGLDSMTGGRLLRVGKYINSGNFMLTYGDGVSDVNISNLLKFHKSIIKLALSPLSILLQDLVN